MSEEQPRIALCHECQKLVVGDEIVRYRLDGTWLKWCWPCFKRSHLKNLTRLQEEKP